MGYTSRRPDGIVTPDRSATPQLETLEARLLLSGTAYVVDSLADTVAADGVVTLREAIDAANTNTAVTADVAAGSATEADSITFSYRIKGTITLDGAPLILTDDLEIIGPGSERLTLDGGATFWSNRVLQVDSGAVVSLSGLKIAGGAADGRGGGIYNDGTLTLTHVAVVDNLASAAGGGIYNSLQGSLTMSESYVMDNIAGGVAGGTGGGIHNAGTLTMMHAGITSNEARGTDSLGGGLYNDHAGTVTLSCVDVVNNTAVSGGGVVHRRGTLRLGPGQVTRNDGGGVLNHAALAIDRARIVDNRAASGGGILSRPLDAPDADAPTLTLVNVLLRGNEATIGNGGAIHSHANAALALTNVALVQNTAAGGGGGLYHRGPDAAQAPALTNVTVADNTAATGAGGILNDTAGTMALNNSIVASNRGAGAAGEIAGAFAGTHNLIGGDPRFVSPRQWDYRLAFDSPAIDGGSDALIGPDATDIDGDGDTDEPVPLDVLGNPRTMGGLVDLGAYEYDTRRSTFVVNAFDGAAPGATTLHEAIAAAALNRDESDTAFDRITFDVPALQAAAGPGTPLVIAVDVYGFYITEDVEIVGPGPDVLTIDGAGRDSVFEIRYEKQVFISGLTITGGHNTHGGGIDNNRSMLSLSNVTIRGNTAADDSSYDVARGGGIFNGPGAILRLSDVTLADNTAEEGGGIYNDGIQTSGTDVTFTGNTAGLNGGGLYNTDRPMVLSDALFTNNTAGAGGGLYNDTGDVTLRRTTFVANTATAEGGGLYNANAPMAVTDSVFRANTADIGGGVFNRWLIHPMTMTNTLVIGNAARSSGGIKSGAMVLTNVTVADNTASSFGGIGNGSELVMNNSIVALNSADDQYPNLWDVPAGANNLIGVDPGFVDAAGGDYRLATDSAAIDAGDASLLPADDHDLDADGDTAEPVPVDLDGNRRVVGGGVDIGAFEYQGTPGDADRDGDVDLDDFLVLKQHFGLPAGATWAMGDFNASRSVDLDDFVLLKQHFGAGAAPVASATVGVLATTDRTAKDEPVRARRRRVRRLAQGETATGTVLDLSAAGRLGGRGGKRVPGTTACRASDDSIRTSRRGTRPR
ncbi:MAG: choice-of-anchor Q domain-containing protein [Planctomycetota bacterium]